MGGSGTDPRIFQMAEAPFLLFGKFPGNFIKQENIPVGCVPSAAVAVPGRGVSPGRGCLSVGVCPAGVCPQGCLPGGVSD